MNAIMQSIMAGEKVNLIIVGTSGHARVALDHFRSRGRDYNVLGFLDSKPKSMAFGLPVLGTPEQAGEVELDHEEVSYFIAIGDNHVRARISNVLRKQIPGIKFANAIHASAVISPDSRLGEGVMVGALAVINPGTTVGDFAIINTLASVDHDNVIGSFVHIAPHGVTAGNVMVGDYSTIWMNASVKQGLVIGRNCVVAGNAFLRSDMVDNTIARGIPAVVTPR